MVAAVGCYSDVVVSSDLSVQCPPLNRITLGQHKSDNNNQMIQLTNIFCVLFRISSI